MKDLNTIIKEMYEDYGEEELQNALDVLSDLEYVTGKEFPEPMRLLTDIINDETFK